MTTLHLTAVTKREAGRWIGAAILVVAVHTGFAAGMLYWPGNIDAPGTALQPIMLDLESAPPNPNPIPDVAPGQLSNEAAPPPEEQRQEIAEEQIPSTPEQENPTVVAPPKEEAKPVPVKDKPKPKPITPPKKQIDKPSPTTSAPPAEARAARASYNGEVAAHLQRFKKPDAVNAADASGTASVSFTLSRGGQVVGSRLAGSSGSSALDAEALAMVRRAQPYPGFPADIKESTLSFTVPVRFRR